MGLTLGRQTKETYLLSKLPIDCHPNDKMCHHCVHYSVGKQPFAQMFAGHKYLNICWLNGLSTKMTVGQMTFDQK
jgi:hypothetical protein